MGKLKNIYDYSPRFLRNMYINAYGIKNIFRFKKWDKLLHEIEYTETLDKEAQIDLVEKKLKDIVKFAINNVPFYTKFSSLKGDIDNKSIYNVLKELPIINKEEINKHQYAFLSKKRTKYLTSKTSGTTGTPLTVYMDRFTDLLSDALQWRRTKWAGYEKGDWIARLVGDPIIPLRIKNPKKPWIVSRFDKRVYLSTFHLSKNTSRKMGMLLNKLQPAFIMGYPSSLEILCGYLNDINFQMHWVPKKILFSSEPMYPHQEKIIRSVFRSDIRGLLASGEKTISASQCQKGTYHLSLIDGYVEGQFGIMDNKQPALLTTFSNKSMPLIRYQQGDVIETKPSSKCECGRTLPIISPVITKDEDWIITPSGRKVSPSAITWAFIHQDIKGIKKSQVVQCSRKDVKVYLNMGSDNFLKNKNILKESLNKVFFDEMNIEIIKSDQIEIKKSGKSRFVVNKLRKRK